MKLKRNSRTRKNATLTSTSIHPEIPIAETIETEDLTLKKFATHGVYIRRILRPDLELAILKRNAAALKRNKIKTPEDLAKFFSLGKDGTAPLVKNFIFRPSTLIKKGRAIHLFRDAPLGLIIDPKASSTLATHFYKKNMISSRIASKQFSLTRPSRIKNVGSLINLSSKLQENEKRRRGEQWDNYNRVFGIEKNEHNEILLTHTPDILGIELTASSNIEAALNFRKKLQAFQTNAERLIPFYKYDSSGELEIVPETIITQDLKSKKELCTFMMHEEASLP